MLIVQAVLGEVVGKKAAAVSQFNTKSNIEVAKLQIFDGAANKVSGFLIVYKLYIRMRMRETPVKK